MPYEAADFYDVDSLLTEEERVVRDTVRGFVDERPVSAHWRHRRLECDPEVLHRMQVMVAMADSFDLEPRGLAIDASLDGSRVGGLLTAIRAFTRTTHVEVRWENAPQGAG